LPLLSQSYQADFGSLLGLFRHPLQRLAMTLNCNDSRVYQMPTLTTQDAKALSVPAAIACRINRWDRHCNNEGETGGLTTPKSVARAHLPRLVCYLAVLLTISKLSRSAIISAIPDERRREETPVSEHAPEEKPLPTIWRVPDELWERIEPILAE
jgi:hypothetical protein